MIDSCFQNEKGADEVEEMLRGAVQGKVTLFLSPGKT